MSGACYSKHKEPQDCGVKFYHNASSTLQWQWSWCTAWPARRGTHSHYWRLHSTSTRKDHLGQGGTSLVHFFRSSNQILHLQTRKMLTCRQRLPAMLENLKMRSTGATSRGCTAFTTVTTPFPRGWGHSSLPHTHASTCRAELILTSAKWSLRNS